MKRVSILWNRLDTPGHDACTLVEGVADRRLDGGAVFLHEGVPARLEYNVACDNSWRTQRGEVHGWVGTEPIDFVITRSAEGVWTCNGAIVSGLDDCVDLDLGFTPATNLFQIRRLALTEGQAADAPVAWFDVSSGALDVLVQRYERRATHGYWYEAPRFNYAGLLEVGATGFVHLYPGLWTALASEPAEMDGRAR